jgi:hypothetical protein
LFLLLVGVWVGVSSTGQLPGQEISIALEIGNWLRENAIPFDTTEPGSDFADLMPLKEIIGDARIVALGEATHGTHEFFQMKRLILSAASGRPMTRPIPGHFSRPWPCRKYSM